MDVRIDSAKLGGSVKAVASKSDAHRALICAAFAEKPCFIELSSSSADIDATCELLCKLGARAARERGGILLEPVDLQKYRGGKTAPCELHCGESGSTLRFMLPVAAALGADATFTGGGRLPQRPMLDICEQLKANGCKLECKDGGFLPIRVSGGLKTAGFVLPGNVSSQYVSGLLFALPLLPNGGTIRLTSALESSGYVALTRRVLKAFGVESRETACGYECAPKAPFRSPGRYSVEGDWSQAAFWLCASFLGASVRVEGLAQNSLQGDKAVCAILEQFEGAGDIEVDARNIPDIVPVLAVAACGRRAKTTFSSCARLRLKESDRIESTCAMIRALGGKAEGGEDSLVVRGSGALRGGTVDGVNDHRIVMSAAVASVLCAEPVTILGAQAVEKSYPAFFEDFAALGGKVTELPR